MLIFGRNQHNPPTKNLKNKPKKKHKVLSTGLPGKSFPKAQLCKGHNYTCLHTGIKSVEHHHEPNIPSEVEDNTSDESGRDTVPAPGSLQPNKGDKHGSYGYRKVYN